MRNGGPKSIGAHTALDTVGGEDTMRGISWV
jgi:hypothetical protein